MSAAQEDARTSQSGVSTFELFFDLVFVFTITQVALIVEHHPGWHAAVQSVVELTVIYWMYGGYAWLANHLQHTNPGRQRLVLLVGMAAFFVCSLAVPRAFGADAVAFGLAYLALNALHMASFVILTGGVTAAGMVRVGSSNLLAAALVLAAGFVDDELRLPLWLAAVAVQWLVPLVGGTRRMVRVSPAHFAERHQLMIIIVLGESLVSVALATDKVHVDLRLVAGALCGLLALTALWWAYFSGDDEAALDALTAMPEERQGAAALYGYDATHIAMLAGVVFVAAGTRLSLPDLLSTTDLAAASFIGAGVALYLLGEAVFRVVLGFGSPVSRALTALLALATIPVGTAFGAAQQLLVVAALVAAMLLAERRLGWANAG